MQYRPKQKSNIGIIAGVALVLVVSLIGYTNFSGKNVRASSNLIEATSTSEFNSPFSPEQLAMLTKIESITLDDSLFKNANFLSLQDWTVDLVPEPVGKANPFAPSSLQSQPVSSTRNTTTRR